ncbi:MAG: asparagine synthase (glutamine-hydrolyzing) [Phycisphaeraceae bacterium]|nr:asparagine synthase (glutamine-hydrolyzing) [Phycisphaeraceae bacterium]
MCGIAGILRFDGSSPDARALAGMLAQVRHRGPDDQGTATLGPCSLAHARLSILDLADGHQPMDASGCATCGDLAVVFNGEIYNHRDLRKQLESHGHRFRTDHSDTEVLLHGWRQWGLQLPNRLEGMFALALWDGRDRKLMLTRDRTGKKPLYWHRGPRQFAFASVIPSVVASLPDMPAVNRQSLGLFLRLGYTGHQTLLDGIEELPAGHRMIVSADGRTQCEAYWQLPPPSRSSTSVMLTEGLLELLDDAVGKRLEADVPLGCFLSGGIDSSIVAALAQRRLARQGGQLRTFCVRMPDSAYDESNAAATVARHIGSQHTVLDARPEAPIMDDLRKLMAIYGEPTADSSILPTYWLSVAARRHVKVALSGDGGDETFGGYDRYRAIRLLARHRQWVSRLPVLLLPQSNPKSAFTRLRRLVEAATPQQPARQYQSMMRLFSTAQIRQLGLDLGGNGQDDLPMPDWPEHENVVISAMRWDLTHYLPMDVLRKVDRASMAAALEVRCPLLDTAVVELAMHVPPELLMPGNKPKGLLRQVAAKRVPAEIVNRPKQGFALPIGRWFGGELRLPLEQHLGSGDLESLGLSALPVRQWLLEHVRGEVDHTHRLFALLQLTLWVQWLSETSRAMPRDGSTAAPSVSTMPAKG